MAIDANAGHFGGHPLMRLVAVMWLAPLITLAVAGWWAWRVDISDARAHTVQAVRFINDRIENTIQTQALALDWILDRSGSLNWNEIEGSDVVHQLLGDLDRRYYESAEIYLADANGVVRASSLRFPATEKYAPIVAELRDKRDAFDRVSVFPGDSSTLSEEPVFLITRCRLTPTGAFDGIAVVAIRSEFFGELFRIAAVGNSGTIRLYSDDGAILAENDDKESRHDVSPEYLRSLPKSDSPFAIFANGPNHRFELPVYVMRLRSYPLIVSYSVDEAALLDTWLVEFFTYGVVAFVSGLALTFAAIVAIRAARQESRAIAGWQNEIVQRAASDLAASKLLKFEALGTLAGGIAHYFNNMLPALQGHLEIASEEARAGRPIPELIARLSNAVSEAREFLTHILTFSGRTTTRFEEIDLSALVDSRIKFLSSMAPKSISIEKSIEPNIHVYGQANQLGDVVGNILKNAIEAMPSAQGELRFALRVEARAGAEMIARFSCADTGVGMSQVVIDRALDPFFTTKSALTSGLGLAISDGVIRAHGGQIMIESTVGVGSTISFTLPLVSGD